MTTKKREISDEEHIQHLLLEHARLIHSTAKSVARKYNLPNLSAEDLHNHGVHGFYDALSKYTPDKGSFANYAKIRIEGIMRDTISGNKQDLGNADSNKIDPYHYKQNKVFENKRKAEQPLPDTPQIPKKPEE